jgi:hypothetical protein
MVTAAACIGFNQLCAMSTALYPCKNFQKTLAEFWYGFMLTGHNSSLTSDIGGSTA